MTTRLLSLALLGVTFGACTSDNGHRSGPVVRDSAGIALIDNHGDGQWRDSERPSVEVDVVIGGAEGDDDYTFGRIADVAIDGHGQFFVLDELAQEVKVYDPSGTFVRKVGRAGEGPGELGATLITVLVSTADTLFVPDESQKRVNVYGPLGTFTRTIHLPAEYYALGWVIAGGGLLFQGMTVSFDAAQRWQTWDGLLVMPDEGTSFDTLMAFDYEPADIGTVAEIRLPLIRNSVFWDRLDDGRIAWSSLDQERVFVHAQDGTLDRVVTHGEWRLRPASAADRATLADLYRQKTQRPSDAPLPASIVLPDTLPAITGLRAGPAGTFWVQRMGEVESVDPEALGVGVRTDWLGGTYWDVFDGTGRLLGGLQFPDRFRVTRITDAGVVGVQKDDFDVERVVRLRLR